MNYKSKNQTLSDCCKIDIPILKSFGLFKEEEIEEVLEFGTRNAFDHTFIRAMTFAKLNKENDILTLRTV